MAKRATQKARGIKQKKKIGAPARKTVRKAAPTRKKPEKKIPTVARKKVSALLKKAKRTVAKREVALKKRVRPVRYTTLEELISKVKVEEFPAEERRIEESKFDIGVPHNAKVVPSYDIPFEYYIDRAVILTVDPRFVFAYWEVRPESLHDAASRIGHNAKLTLRFYDISNTGDPFTSPYWDIEVFDRLGNWYLRLEYPEQRLILDVGLKNEFGVFHTIARSNLIRLPRQSLAAPGPLKWMVVTPDGQKLVTDVEEYTDADLELLRKILGPYFFDLLMRGQFASIAGSSLEAVFQEIAALKVPLEISSSPSSWSSGR